MGVGINVWASIIGTGRTQTGESYLGCHIHVNTLVSRRIQPEAGGCSCDNQWTCVHMWVRNIGTGKVQVGESYLACHIHVDTLVSRRNQSEAGGSGCDNQWTCVYVWASSIGTEKVQDVESYLGCHEYDVRTRDPDDFYGNLQPFSTQ